MDERLLDAVTDVCELNLGMWHVYLIISNARRFCNLPGVHIYTFAYIYLQVSTSDKLIRQGEIFPGIGSTQAEMYILHATMMGGLGHGHVCFYNAICALTNAF